MSLTIVGAQLERAFEILDGAARFTQVIARVAAVHKCGGIGGVNLDGARVGVFGLTGMSGMSVDVAFDQRQITVLRQHRLELPGNLESIVIALEEKQVVSQIN